MKPKFKRGDVLFIRDRNARFGAATFTVKAVEYDKRIRTWFYRDSNGPLYAQSLLELASKGGK